MSFESILKRYFPVFDREAGFVDRTYRILNESGFDADNTIACVGVCRDEISQPLVTVIKEKWGEAFNLCSLAGMFFAGKTGLKAAMQHAPVVSGKERYVYFALPHIAIGEQGQIGICLRRGREGASHACGALHLFQEELSGGRLNLLMENEDMELHLMKMRLMREIPYGHVPDLLELTRIAQRVIQADLEQALDRIVDKTKSDYVLLTGIQIHGPNENYIWPGECYFVVNGIKTPIIYRTT